MIIKNLHLYMSNGSRVDIGSGINDTTGLANVISGGDLLYSNNLFGATGVANNGQQTKLVIPGIDKSRFWDILFESLDANQKYPSGYTGYRAGFHDAQTTLKMLNTDETIFLKEIRRMCRIAEAHSVKVILTMGGFSDKSTWTQLQDLFVRGSPLYESFTTRCAKTCDVLDEFPDTVLFLEALNEADYLAVVEGYWKKQGATALDIVKAFAKWQLNLLNDIRWKQKHPGKTLLSMGTAVDSSIYPMNWKDEIKTPNIIPLLWSGCDVPCVHTYVNENYPDHWDVWFNQKLPAFVACARSLGNPLFVGETGRHFEGGTYDANMDTALWNSEIANYFWMIRWWNPTYYVIPKTWTDIGTLDAPVETVVVTPPVVTTPVDSKPETPDASVDGVFIRNANIITTLMTVDAYGKPVILYLVKDY